MSKLLFNPQKSVSVFEYPDYIPKKCNDSSSLVDTTKYYEFLNMIKQLDIPENDRIFLSLAATRFISFNYHFIADYYNTVDNKDIKSIMEKLGLIILDKDGIIKNGYIEVNNKISKLLD